MDWLKKKAVRLLYDESGTSGGSMIVFLLIFLVALSVTVEFGRAVFVKGHVEQDLNRALNIAVAMSMKDEFRRDHISSIDPAVSDTAFKDYLHDEMALNASLQHVVNGQLQYAITIRTLSIEETPPRMTLTATLHIPNQMLTDLVNVQLDLPLTIASRNQRIEDYVFE